MDLLNPPRLDKKNVRKSFNRAATSYNRVAILQEEVLSRVINRLEYIRLDPSVIVDLGCGTGKGILGLKKRYPRSRIVAFDLANQMLEQAKNEFGWRLRKRLVNGDIEKLPFKEGCFDLVFSSLALQWMNDLPAAFREVARVTRPGGLFMFTTFGPATLSELRDSWAGIDNKPHVHQFIDMHDVGDLLIRAGFSDPVIDSETIRLEYGDFKSVLHDLKGIGATNSEIGRGKGLTTPSTMRQLEKNYQAIGYSQERFVASYEVLYGHAWVQ
ncbi:MAG: malonyl-CoA O-methyltransferase [Gammaproteobacteria bacterium]